MKDETRIVVAMSGGVDSSVAAALLLDAGHEVVGVTLRLQECREGRASRSCCGADGIARARAIAGQLGIRHYVLDCVETFETEVLRPAWDDYDRGRTPSPCLPCNERVKFGALLRWALQLGAAGVATGHYARVVEAPEGGFMLLRGRDTAKDQSYFLAGLSRETLAAVSFPLGHLTKPEVRERARALGLATAETHESQDACLVGAGESFAEMLRARFGGVGRAGAIVDEAGRVLGQHEGIHHFTVGQRKGLGVASLHRLWVKSISAADATVVVTDREAALRSERLVARPLNWLGPAPPVPGQACEVQVRYRHTAVPATIAACDEGAIEVVFARPVKAVTSGQAAVFYDGARVLGRGFIDLTA